MKNYGLSQEVHYQSSKGKKQQGPSSSSQIVSQTKTETITVSQKDGAKSNNKKEFRYMTEFNENAENSANKGQKLPARTILSQKNNQFEIKKKGAKEKLLSFGDESYQVRRGYSEGVKLFKKSATLFEKKKRSSNFFIDDDEKIFEISPLEAQLDAFAKEAAKKYKESSNTISSKIDAKRAASLEKIVESSENAKGNSKNTSSNVLKGNNPSQTQKQMSNNSNLLGKNDAVSKTKDAQAIQAMKDQSKNSKVKNGSIKDVKNKNSQVKGADALSGAQNANNQVNGDQFRDSQFLRNAQNRDGEASNQYSAYKPNVSERKEQEDKTIVLLPGQTIEPKSISETIENPVEETVVNPDGTTSVVMKQTKVTKIITNTPVEVPKVDIVKNAPTLPLVKQHITYLYKTVTSNKGENIPSAANANSASYANAQAQQGNINQLGQQESYQPEQEQEQGNYYYQPNDNQNLAQNDYQGEKENQKFANEQLMKQFLDDLIKNPGNATVEQKQERLRYFKYLYSHCCNCGRIGEYDENLEKLTNFLSEMDENAKKEILASLYSGSPENERLYRKLVMVLKKKENLKISEKRPKQIIDPNRFVKSYNKGGQEINDVQRQTAYENSSMAGRQALEGRLERQSRAPQEIACSNCPLCQKGACSQNRYRGQNSNLNQGNYDRRGVYDTSLGNQNNRCTCQLNNQSRYSQGQGYADGQYGQGDYSQGVGYADRQGYLRGNNNQGNQYMQGQAQAQGQGQYGQSQGQNFQGQGNVRGLNQGQYGQCSQCQADAMGLTQSQGQGYAKGLAQGEYNQCSQCSQCQAEAMGLAQGQYGQRAQGQGNAMGLAQGQYGQNPGLYTQGQGNDMGLAQGQYGQNQNNRGYGYEAGLSANKQYSQGKNYSYGKNSRGNKSESCKVVGKYANNYQADMNSGMRLSKNLQKQYDSEDNRKHSFDNMKVKVEGLLDDSFLSLSKYGNNQYSGKNPFEGPSPYDKYYKDRSMKIKMRLSNLSVLEKEAEEPKNEDGK